MIELWSWPSANGRQVHILLEETGLPYTTMPVNTGSGGQLNQEFLSIAPNYRIPAIVDDQGRCGKVTLFEPGAILIYLAEKAGNFIPFDPAARYICLQWLMFQMGCIGPALQNHQSLDDSPRLSNPGTFESSNREVQRLARVLETRLAEDDYLAGTYSIADMAAYPWIIAAARRAINLDSYPATRRWVQKLGSRPAVERGMTLMQELQEG